MGSEGSHDRRKLTGLMLLQAAVMNTASLLFKKADDEDRAGRADKFVKEEKEGKEEGREEGMEEERRERRKEGKTKRRKGRIKRRRNSKLQVRNLLPTERFAPPP